MKMKSIYLLSAVFIGAHTGATAVYAQSTPETSPSNSVETSDIVVTAQKRAERILDVPISITAITSEDIAKKNLIGAEDYLRGVPGVNEVEGAFGSQVTIRGIRSDNAQRDAVATYFGEVQTTGLAGTYQAPDIKLVDIERIEILRGPQGTAFGASALSGVVRNIPVAPKTDRFEVKAIGSYGFVAREGGRDHMIQGTVNVPVVEDVLAVRASAYQVFQSGFVKNVAGSLPGFKDYLVGLYGPDIAARAVDRKRTGSERHTGGRVSVLFQPIEDLKLTGVYMKQKSFLLGVGRSGSIFSPTDVPSVATIGAYEQVNLEIHPNHVRNGDPAGYNSSNVDIFSGTVEYDAGWASLLATGSHTVNHGSTVFSFPGLNFWSTSMLARNRASQGEVRALTKFDFPLNVTLGAYADSVKGYYNFDILYLGSVNTTPFGGQAASQDFVDAWPFAGSEIRDDLTKQKAIFGEARLEFGKLTATAGARYSDYDKSTTISSAGFYTGSPKTVQTTIVGGGSNTTTYKGGLSYKPGKDVNLYATFSQGFRLGAPLGPVNPQCDVDQDGIIDGTAVRTKDAEFLKSDKLSAYEVGVKATTADRKFSVDAAIFRNDWNGLPFLVYTGRPLTSGCGLFQFNAGKARTQGVELQATLHPMPALELNLGGSYITAEIMEDLPAAGITAGAQLPGAPKFIMNFGGQYDFSPKLYVRIDGIYVSKYESFFVNPGAVNTGPSGGYVKFDGAVNFTIYKNLVGNVFVKNITNSAAFTSKESGDLNNYGWHIRPRTIGFQLSYTM